MLAVTADCNCKYYCDCKNNCKSNCKNKSKSERDVDCDVCDVCDMCVTWETAGE